MMTFSHRQARGSASRTWAWEAAASPVRHKFEGEKMKGYPTMLLKTSDLKIYLRNIPRSL
jgi:hypothetical protein